MNFATTHPGGRGPSLVEQIQDSLDLAVRQAEDAFGEGDAEDLAHKCGVAAGVARALGILRSTSEDREFELSEQRIGLHADEDEEETKSSCV